VGITHGILLKRRKFLVRYASYMPRFLEYIEKNLIVIYLPCAGPPPC
jgi:hypothetical protein